MIDHPFKSRTWRSSSYMQRVRDMPCCACFAEGPSDPHHYGPKGESGGTGLKCSDAYVIPLCHVCHMHLHATSTVRGLNVPQSREWLMDAQRRIMARAIEEGDVF